MVTFRLKRELIDIMRISHEVPQSYRDAAATSQQLELLINDHSRVTRRDREVTK